MHWTKNIISITLASDKFNHLNLGKPQLCKYRKKKNLNYDNATRKLELLDCNSPERKQRLININKKHMDGATN